MNSIRIILASASPRRRELLALLGLPFEVIPGDVDENITAPTPADHARHLAEVKAVHVAKSVGESRSPVFVIGADTIVVAPDGQILNKPADVDDATRMLKLLSGRKHTVLTGVAIASGAGSILSSKAVSTAVEFRELSEEMIGAYVATDEPFDKAGGYGIQGGAAPFTVGIAGCYFNVMGLPVSVIGEMLEAAGIRWWHGPESLASPDGGAL